MLNLLPNTVEYAGVDVGAYDRDDEDCDSCKGRIQVDVESA